MKRRGIIGILLLGLVLITAAACGGGGEVTTTQPTVKSDINVIVTGDGNIEASSHERLTFGSGGKVDKIYVEEGDEVSKGEILAELEKDLEKGALELALIQAELALETAEYNLNTAREIYTKPDIEEARTAVHQAQAYLDNAQERYDQAFTVNEMAKWANEIDQAERILARAIQRRDNMLATGETEEVALRKLEVEVAMKAVEEAQRQAQKQLDEATIIAPFDGTVYKIGAKEGEFLSPAAFTERTIVEIINLSHMELIARVDELDIAKVKTGQKVMISVDAMPETKLEGRVTFISPVAREPGVVLFEDEDEEKEYEVKIDFDIPENSPIRAGMSATAEIIVE